IQYCEKDFWIVTFIGVVTPETFRIEFKLDIAMDLTIHIDTCIVIAVPISIIVLSILRSHTGTSITGANSQPTVIFIFHSEFIFVKSDLYITYPSMIVLKIITIQPPILLFPVAYAACFVMARRGFKAIITGSFGINK